MRCVERQMELKMNGRINSAGISSKILWRLNQLSILVSCLEIKISPARENHLLNNKDHEQMLEDQKGFAFWNY